MTQDEIIDMAKQAGLMADGEMWFSPTYGSGDVHISHLDAFAKLVAAKEREACAEVCDDIHAEHEAKGEFSSYAEAIRARGET